MITAPEHATAAPMHPAVSLNFLCFGDATAGVRSTGVGLPEALDFSAAAGFGRVGVTWSKVEAYGVARSVERIRRSGLVVSTLLVGRFLTVHEPSLWAGEVATLCERLAVAVEIGAETAYGWIGPAGDLDWDEAARRVRDGVADAVALARQLGIPLIFESTPTIYADLDFVHSFRDAIALARMAGLGVCMDLFQVWQERGLLQTAADAIDVLHLVQASDFGYPCRSLPDRWVPGDGVIPLQRLLAGLTEAGYRGAVDLELIGPRIEAETAELAAVRAGRYVSGLLGPLRAS